MKYKIEYQYTSIGTNKRASLGAVQARMAKQRGDVTLSLLDEEENPVISWLVNLPLLEENKEDQKLQDAILRFKN